MNFKKFAIKYVPLIFIAILIIVLAVSNTAAVLNSPDFEANYPNETKTTFTVKAVIKTLPTLITLVVQVLLVAANRNGLLLGGCNAALYGVSNLLQGLHFSAISALLISSPIQIISFFTWKKNSKDKKVIFKRMSPVVLISTIAIILGGWALCYFLLAPFFSDATFPVLDTLTFAIGTVCTIIVALRFIESQYINIISCLIQLVLYIIISVRDPSNISYIVISAYNLYRVAEAAISWTKQYLGQKNAAQNA